MSSSYNSQTIILASASPRRAELLDQIGVKYQIQVADINENSIDNEDPEDLVKRLAKQKAEKVSINNYSIPVLGADTLGVLNDGILNKPRDFDHAYEMLSGMSGNWHEILSAVALSYQGKTTVLLNKNRVLFKILSDKEIKNYWQTGEPQDKAGAYAIQGLAATYIERIEGSYSGIMGLPLYETQHLLDNLNDSK